jgi:predicted kinase
MFDSDTVKPIKELIRRYAEPILLLTVGFPLSGKDTLISLLDLKDFYILSRDKIMEEINPEKNYRSNYTQTDSRLTDKLFFRKMDELNKLSNNTIINATNLTKSKRRKTMLRFPGYSKICLILPDIDKESFMERNRERTLKTGKRLSDSLFEEMNSFYEKVGAEEGWDLIIDLNNC